MVADCDNSVFRINNSFVTIIAVQPWANPLISLNLSLSKMELGPDIEIMYIKCLGETCT